MLLTFEERSDVPDFDLAAAGELSEGDLEEEERDSDQRQRQDVRDEEGAWRSRASRGNHETRRDGQIVISVEETDKDEH